jgi:hypothetical protein
VDDILLIRNDLNLLDSAREYLNSKFSKKDLGETAYVLCKICRDRSRPLLALSQSTYLEKVLKGVKMNQSKKGFLPVQKGKPLSLTQYLAIEKEKE